MLLTSVLFLLLAFLRFTVTLTTFTFRRLFSFDTVLDLLGSLLCDRQLLFVLLNCSHTSKKKSEHDSDTIEL